MKYKYILENDFVRTGHALSLQEKRVRKTDLQFVSVRKIA